MVEHSPGRLPSQKRNEPKFVPQNVGDLRRTSFSERNGHAPNEPTVGPLGRHVVVLRIAPFDLRHSFASLCPRDKKARIPAVSDVPFDECDRCKGVSSCRI